MSKGISVAGRPRNHAARAVVLALLWLLAPAAAGAVSFDYTLLAQIGESPCGSRVKVLPSVSPSCYDTFDDFTPLSGTVLTLTVDAPDIASISAGDTITLENFFLPATQLSVDLGLGDTMLVTLGLSNLGTGLPGDPVIPNPTDDQIASLSGTLFDVGGGRLGVLFPTFDIYWSGSRFGATDSGIIPFQLRTTQVTINSSTTNPERPGTCAGLGATSVGYPGFPMPLGGSDFSVGSTFVLGGGTCPTGIGSLSGLGELPFSIELQGTIVPEPGTLLLVTSGLAGLAAIGRRRPLA
jgi:hypothetical protein